MIPGPISLTGRVTATRPDLFRSFVVGGTGGQSYVRLNNVNYLVSCNTGEGQKAIQVFNADTGALHATFDTPGKASSGYAHDGAGNFYFESVDTIQHINILNKTIRTVGPMPASTETGMTAVIDYKGRLWFGSYSSKDAGAARVICVDPNTGAEIARSPRLGTNNDYVQEMSISEDGKTIWAGTGTATPSLYSIPVDSPSTPTNHPIPDCGPAVSPRAQVRGNTVFVWHNTLAGASTVSAYFTGTKTWKTSPHFPSGRSFSLRQPDGKVYFAYRGVVKSLDPHDTSLTATDIATIPDLYTQNFHVLNNVAYTMAAGNEQLRTHRIDLTTKAVTSYQNDIVLIPLLVQSVAIEKETDTVYAGGYQGDGICSTSLITGDFAHSVENVGIGQVEGMMFDGRRLYIGAYGNAIVFKHETTSPVTAPTSYRKIKSLYPEYPQDRPFAWANTPTHVVFGTVPKPNYRGGALGVINKSTLAVDVYPNLVPNHSIIDATEDPSNPDLVYVTTSGRPGYGIDDYLGPAIIFCFNVATRTVVWQKEIANALELYGPVIILGKMYVANAKYIWQLDMQGNIVKEFEVFAWAGRAGWKNVELKQIPGTHRLVHASGSYVRILDPSTHQVSQILEDKVSPHLDFDVNGNLWIVRDNGFIKVEVDYPEPHGAIGYRYRDYGGPGLYGYAYTPEVATNVDGGVVQKTYNQGKDYHFYWSSAHGAHLVEASTGIGGRFLADGGHNTYGLPTTDGRVIPDKGYYQMFQKGSAIYKIMWSSSTGAWPVKMTGAIGKAWQNAGSENGWGFPVTGEYYSGSEIHQRFVKNGVTTTARWTSTNGVWLT